jgi:hypothetical protein
MPFLSLPQELRDTILLYAIVTSANPCRLYNGAKQSLYHEPDDLDHIARIRSKGVYYSRRPTNTALNLLLSSRQLHNETKAIINHYHKVNGNNYKLNVILLDEEHLACSWTHVPPLCQEVDSLEVTFRIQGISGNSNAFMAGQLGTSPAIWRLYSVIERFLRCGASPPKTQSWDLNLRVKELRIKILMPDLQHPMNMGCIVADPTIFPDIIPRFRSDNQHYSKALMHPDALARFMFIWLEALMKMSDPTYAGPYAPLRRYGGVFIDRVGKVVLAAEGGEKYETFPWEYGSPADVPELYDRGVVHHTGMFDE